MHSLNVDYGITIKENREKASHLQALESRLHPLSHPCLAVDRTGG